MVIMDVPDGVLSDDSLMDGVSAVARQGRGCIQLGVISRVSCSRQIA